MEVKSLTIERRPTYDSEYPNQLIGLVRLSDANGSQEIRLTNENLAEVFRVITTQVVGTAKANSKAVAVGMLEAQHEPLLVGASKVEALGALDDIPF
jgi:hypothetical protein